MTSIPDSDDEPTLKVASDATNVANAVLEATQYDAPEAAKALVRIAKVLVLNEDIASRTNLAKVMWEVAGELIDAAPATMQ